MGMSLLQTAGAGRLLTPLLPPLPPAPDITCHEALPLTKESGLAEMLYVFPCEDNCMSPNSTPDCHTAPFAAWACPHHPSCASQSSSETFTRNRRL